MEAVSGLFRYGQAHEWFERHHQELVGAFEGEWVAVTEGVIVDHDQDLNKLVHRLREGKIIPGPVYIDYVSREPLVALL